MKVHWTNEFLEQIEAIVEYISKDNVSAALALCDSIFEQVEKILPNNPKAGRPGRVDGTRELVVHASYLVAYRISDEAIEVLTVMHAARLWPVQF